MFHARMFHLSMLHLVCTVFTMDTSLHVLVGYYLYDCTTCVFYFMCIILVWCASVTPQ